MTKILVTWVDLCNCQNLFDELVFLNCRKIIDTVEEARQAATKGVIAAIKALEKANPTSGNLKTKADQVATRKHPTLIEIF
jgi:hypothetical protein